MLTDAEPNASSPEGRCVGESPLRNSVLNFLAHLLKCEATILAVPAKVQRSRVSWQNTRRRNRILAENTAFHGLNLLLQERCSCIERLQLTCMLLHLTFQILGVFLPIAGMDLVFRGATHDLDQTAICLSIPQSGNLT